MTHGSINYFKYNLDDHFILWFNYDYQPRQLYLVNGGIKFLNTRDKNLLLGMKPNLVLHLLLMRLAKTDSLSKLIFHFWNIWLIESGGYHLLWLQQFPLSFTTHVGKISPPLIKFSHNPNISAFVGLWFSCFWILGLN